MWWNTAVRTVGFGKRIKHCNLPNRELSTDLSLEVSWRQNSTKSSRADSCVKVCEDPPRFQGLQMGTESVPDTSESFHTSDAAVCPKRFY